MPRKVCTSATTSVELPFTLSQTDADLLAPGGMSGSGGLQGLGLQAGSERGSVETPGREETRSSSGSGAHDGTCRRGDLVRQILDLEEHQ
ncbi:unnamed protein product [Lota lota]